MKECWQILIWLLIMPRNQFRLSNSSWYLLTFVLIFSVFLLIVAIPRFLHELMLLPGTPIYNNLNSGQPISNDELAVIEQSRLNALDFATLPRAYTDLGAVYLIKSQRAQTDEARRKFAHMAIANSMKGLDIAPLNSYAWLRIASAHISLGTDHFPEALKAWRASIATARYDPRLILNRLHIGIIIAANYSGFTQEDKELAKDQLGLAFRWDKKQTIQYARYHKLNDWFVFLSPTSEKARYFDTQNN
jgi:hypothetical protein